MDLYFFMIQISCKPRLNTFVCMVIGIVGDETFFCIRLIEIPNRIVQPPQWSKYLADDYMKSPKCQPLHYLSGSIINPHVAEVTTAFPLGELPSPNLNGNDGSGEGNGADGSDEGNGADRRDHNQPPARHPMYADYNQRLQSFIQRGWPHTRPNPQTLSKAGFLYTGTGDLVRCFQCGIGFKDWDPDDDPMRNHAHYSHNCHFLRQLIGVDSLQNILCSSEYIELYKHQRKSRTNERYRHPEYAELQRRMASFTRWPSGLTQTPMQLAEAGFYYTGEADTVRCFACGGGLRNWDEGDNPWLEHCRWFPNCIYAIEVRGEDYIAQVQAAIDAQAVGDDEDDIQSRIKYLVLSDPVTQTMLNEHQSNCLQLGYDEVDFKSTVQELRNRETPEEKNRRLKSYVYCMQCRENYINTLFLPCGHHVLCMTCAQHSECCPVCLQNIQEKIKTFT